MNEDVVKIAGFELLLLTKQVPDTINNIIETNSFKSDFSGKKFKYIITNPPYGGDKTKNETIKQYEKIEKQLKKLIEENKNDAILISKYQRQLEIIKISKKKEQDNLNKYTVSVANSSERIKKYAKDNDLDGKDKEATSLILFMDLLDENGTCCAVLKEGVFFDAKYAKLRRHLLTKFNVEKIISVPSDQFENTTTKTSILVFHNTKPTEHIDFYELTVDKYEDDVFEEKDDIMILAHNKNDIISVNSKLIKKIKSSKILEQKQVKLDHKLYDGENGFDNVLRLIPKQGFKMVKLGDLCDFMPKSKRNASFGEEIGQYNFYTSSDKVKKCDVADYITECILIGTGGNGCIHLTNNFSCSADIAILKSKDIKYTNYIYTYIKSNFTHIQKSMHGSTIRHLTKSDIVNLQIPIPETDEYLNRITNWILETYNKIQQVNEYIVKCDAFLRNRVKQISENEECESVLLGDMCDIKAGNHSLSRNDFIEGDFPIIAGGTKPIGTHNEYNCNENVTLCTSHGSCGIIQRFPYKTFITMCFAIIPREHFTIYNDFIYVTLLNSQEYIQQNSNVSVIRLISKKLLSEIIVKLPKNKQLITDLQPYFDKLEKAQNAKVQLENKYKQKLEQLSNMSCEYV